MKKAYVKPDIMFESFMLCTNIATGCEHVANHAMDACSYEVEVTDMISYFYFADNVSACLEKKQDGEYNGICYHNPSSLNNVFTS